MNTRLEVGTAWLEGSHTKTRKESRGVSAGRAGVTGGGGTVSRGPQCCYCLWEIIEKIKDIFDNIEQTSLRGENWNLSPGNLTGCGCCCWLLQENQCPTSRMSQCTHTEKTYLLKRKKKHYEIWTTLVLRDFSSRFLLLLICESMLQHIASHPATEGLQNVCWMTV